MIASNTESEVIVLNSFCFTPNVKFVTPKSAKLYPTTFRTMSGNASAHVTSETTLELCWSLEMNKIEYFSSIFEKHRKNVENSTQFM